MVHPSRFEVAVHRSLPAALARGALVALVALAPVARLSAQGAIDPNVAPRAAAL